MSEALAMELEYQVYYGSYDWERVEPMMLKAAAELRRLAAVEQELEALKRKELELHKSLAQAVVHAEQGWARYENANRLSNGLQQELEALKRAISDAEPVAWYTDDHLTDRSATTYSKDMRYRWECKGWPTTPLYTLKGIK